MIDDFVSLTTGSGAIAPHLTPTDIARLAAQRFCTIVVSTQWGRASRSNWEGLPHTDLVDLHRDADGQAWLTCSGMAVRIEPTHL